MLKISYVDSSNLSLEISVQFTLEMCAAAENNCKQNTKTLYFGGSVIQGN